MSGERGDGKVSPQDPSPEVDSNTGGARMHRDNSRMTSRHQHLRSQTQRNSAKLKVLGRSHAMREETSPPREPSPQACISIVTSPLASSPVAAGECNTICDTAPEPVKLNGSPTHVQIQVTKDESKLMQDSAENICAVTSSSDTNTNSSSLNVISKACVEIIDNNLKSEQTSYNCDCFSKICTKCSKNNERNINNNLKDNINNNNNVIVSTTHSSNTLSVCRANTRHKLRQQSSSQGSFDGSSSTSPCLSRDSSTEQYTDCTGIDLQQFIIDTLNKNGKDRVLMLKIEQELLTLAKDKIKSHFKFPAMSSYQRMLVHRCAAYFGMDHNIETSGKCVVVNKTKSTRIPEVKFKEHIREELMFHEEPRRSILKRDSNSFDECSGYKSPDRGTGLDRRSKSFEEREEEYEKVRRRIFKDGALQDCDSQEEFSWSEVPWPDADASKVRLLPPEQSRNRLLKVQSVEAKSDSLRPCVAKSYSFGGYGGSVSVLSRGDSVNSTHSAGPRLLTKQDSSTSTISWRLSPSSSGYKSQSQRSDSVTPSPTATPHQLSDMSGKNSIEDNTHLDDDKGFDGKGKGENQLLWAVTDMQSVPKGSVLINPSSGQPYTNPDGSIYHFDPLNPPPGLPPHPPQSPVKHAQSPVKTLSPHKSPMKDSSTSPKRTRSSSRTSPVKSRSLTSSSTSPTLPQPENACNLPIQPTYMPSTPASYGDVVYQPQMGMVYSPYVTTHQYENRPDSTVPPDLSAYFLNMTIQDPPPQPVNYPVNYWNQTPMYYSPNSANQRYNVPVATPPAPPSYLPPTYPPPGYLPSTPGAEMVPAVYSQPTMQVVYPTPQPTSQTMYVQNPLMYAPSMGYSQNVPYPQTAATPNNNYAQGFSGYTFEKSKGPSVQKNLKTFTRSTSLTHQQSSNVSSGGSSSPAATIIGGYHYGPGPLQQAPPGCRGPAICTPPETPPTHMPTSFSYPPSYPLQQPFMFRQMSSIAASSPVGMGMRSSRSPTPAPDYTAAADPRTQRFPPPTALPACYSMAPVPCTLIASDMRMLNRSQSTTTMYKQQPSMYNRQPPPLSQSPQTEQATSHRNHKQRKSRGKVPALPPSGKHPMQSVPSHSRF